MMRGRPFEPGNRFGRGRPRGSRNKRNLVFEEFLNQYGEKLLGKAAVQAVEGDSALMRLFVSHMASRGIGTTVRAGKLRFRTMEEVDQASEVILQKAAAGQITLEQAHAFSELIEARRRVIETRDLAQRLSALEGDKTTSTNPTPAAEVDPPAGATLQATPSAAKIQSSGSRGDAARPASIPRPGVSASGEKNDAAVLKPARSGDRGGLNNPGDPDGVP